jgi:hypothetical protein
MTAEALLPCLLAAPFLLVLLTYLSPALGLLVLLAAAILGGLAGMLIWVVGFGGAAVAIGWFIRTARVEKEVEVKKFVLVAGFVATAAISFAAAKNISLAEVGAAIREARTPTPSAHEIFDLKAKCQALGDKMLEEDGDYQYEMQKDEEFGKAFSETLDAHRKGTPEPERPMPERAYWHVTVATNYDLAHNHCYVKIENTTANLGIKPFKTSSTLYDGITNELLASLSTEGMAWEKGQNTGHIFDPSEPEFFGKTDYENFRHVVDYIDKLMATKR